MELLKCLETLKVEFQNKISEYKVDISKIGDGYRIQGKKKIILITFWVDAEIIAMDECFELSWKTNAPESKVKEAMEKVKEVLEKC